MKHLHISNRVAQKTFRNPNLTTFDPGKYLSYHYHKLSNILTRCLKTHQCIKFQLALSVELKKQVMEYDKPLFCEPHFVSDMTIVCAENHITLTLRQCSDQILSRFDSYMANGSCWMLNQILCLRLIVVKIAKVLYGGCIKMCKLPAILKNKNALLQLQSPSGLCFGYSIAACLKNNIKIHAERCNHYRKLVAKLKMHEPWMPSHKFHSFEKANKIRLYVYGYDMEMKKITVLYQSEMSHGRKCDILYYNKHYFPIRNLRRLLCKPGSHSPTFACKTCLVTFGKASSLAKHNKICQAKNHQIFCVPDPGHYIQFQNFSHMFKKNFVLYVDFESYLKPMNEKKGAKSVLTETHIPVSFAALRICVNSKFNRGPIIRHGENILKQFWNFLDEEYTQLEEILSNVNYKIQMNVEDEQRYQNAKSCDICKCKFTSDNKKTRDHNHLLKHANFRFVACNRCNLTYGSNKLSPVIVIHNLQSYDSHLLISQLQDACECPRVSIVPKNSERYLSFKIGNWTFIDSLAFLPASLQVLTDSLKEDGLECFEQTRKIACNSERLHYLLRKNPYPYHYPQCLADYEISGLPPKDAFDNKLKGEPISDGEYLYAQQVYNVFNCKSFLDYHKLYLTVDVTLLSDVFERYRTMVMNHYEVDPSYYLSSPQLSMDGFLRTSNIKLECLSDMKQIEMIEAGIRGGISVVSQKHAVANNRYMGELFDEEKPSSYICLFDCCNLYASALRQKLPYRNFKWIHPDEMKNVDFANIDTEQDIGYILEVDLKYDQEIHDLTKDYPLAAEKMIVKNTYLSPHSLNLKKQLCLPKCSQISKLVPNLWDKMNYVLHFVNLKYYLNRGMKLLKIHKIIQFEQKAWLAPFIDANTKRRQEAKSKFQQLYFKQQNNSIFGKLLEQKRKRIDLKLATSETYFDNLVSRPNFTGIKVLNDNMAAISLQKPKIVLDRPLAAGFTTLELSKITMPKFYCLFTQKLYTEIVRANSSLFVINRHG